VPRTLRYENHVLMKGQGLDHVLEQGRAVLILDDFYADIYGDYIFLGYDVYVTVPLAGRGDTLSLLEAAILLDRGPLVVVCGEEPTACLYAVAAHRALHGAEPEEAIAEARKALAGLYGEEPQPSAPAGYSVKAIHRLGRLLGAERISPMLAAGEAYNYGWGRLHYGEALAWLAAVGASDAALLAGALHFLTEGPGEPTHLLRVRLEALGEETLRELLGARTGEVLETLRGFAQGRAEGPAAELLLVETLGPGGGDILYVERRGEELWLHCRRGSEGEPTRGCVERAGRAAELVEKTRPAGLSRVRIA
jgi:hypothetical protein